MPERGRIGILNRSYYEEVLIVRVHPELLRAEALAEPMIDAKVFWKHRYRSITNLERHLHANGTRVVKIFLNLSKDEQRTRFLGRIDDPTKNWKFGTADMTERAYWDAYQTAYEACVSATSTEDAPWYVVPADHKKTARLTVSQILEASFNNLVARRMVKKQQMRWSVRGANLLLQVRVAPAHGDFPERLAYKTPLQTRHTVISPFVPIPLFRRAA